VSDYGREIRASIRGLWLGEFDLFLFFDALTANIEHGLTRAWIEGARDCGINAPQELTTAEINALRQAIGNELGFVMGLADAVMAGNRARGGKLRDVMRRSDNWSNRYIDVRNRARVMACADQKLIWKFNPAKEHCATCAALDGKVKRASTWEAAGLHPQQPPNAALDCRGWKCGCEFEVTDLPLSRGRLPGAGQLNIPTFVQTGF